MFSCGSELKLNQKYNIDTLFKEFSEHNRIALSRLITIIENNGSNYDRIIELLYPLIKGVPRIGFTGPPGVGKSTLVSEITNFFRRENLTVGIIAIDPSSPFTGGALLGDRIRMNRISLDPGVFIRSLATRGSLGGLALATEDTADLFDGFGCDVVLIETVGVGQAELDIVKTADSTIVILSPESGDSVQAMKAGIMEIGSIFVLNKSDRDGADRAYVEIESALMNKPESLWKPPIVKTSANSGSGLEELFVNLNKHLTFLRESGALTHSRIERRKMKIRKTVESRILEKFWFGAKNIELNQLAEENVSVVAASEIILNG